MFCGECGFKNDADARFCAECGKPLIKENEKKKTTPKKKTPKEKKPMSKKKKISIIIGVIVVLILIILYIIGNILTDPKRIAKEYFEANINYDADQLYSYLDIEKSEFTTKAVFEKIINRQKEEEKEEPEITNYKVTDTSISDSGLSMTVTITYTEKGKTGDSTAKILLTKDKKNKYFFFDNWKIANDTLETKEDFELTVLKDSTITLEGIEVDQKYIDQEKSTSTMDVYVLPALFSMSYQMKIELPIGITLEDELDVNSYSNSETIHFDEDHLTEEEKKKLTDQAKKDLSTFYQGIIDQKAFADIQSQFEGEGINLDDLKEEYEDAEEKIQSSRSITLKKIDFQEAEIRNMELDENGYFTMYLSVSYEYTISYEEDGETKERTSSSSDGIYVSYSFVEDTYHLVDVSSLPTYFSRYF